MICSIYHSNYHYYLTTNCTSNFISFLGDRRHDIYLQLVGGYFHKGTKKADKNVEITFTIVDADGKTIPVCYLVMLACMCEGLIVCLIFF